jgi:hypothetical protein
MNKSKLGIASIILAGVALLIFIYGVILVLTVDRSVGLAAVAGVMYIILAGIVVNFAGLIVAVIVIIIRNTMRGAVLYGVLLNVIIPVIVLSVGLYFR